MTSIYQYRDGNVAAHAVSHFICLKWSSATVTSNQVVSFTKLVITVLSICHCSVSGIIDYNHLYHFLQLNIYVNHSCRPTVSILIFVHSLICAHMVTLYNYCHLYIRSIFTGNDINVILLE